MRAGDDNGVAKLSRDPDRDREGEMGRSTGTWSAVSRTVEFLADSALI